MLSRFIPYEGSALFLHNIHVGFFRWVCLRFEHGKYLFLFTPYSENYPIDYSPVFLALHWLLLSEVSVIFSYQNVEEGHLLSML